jgi:hypothetical protein
MRRKILMGVLAFGVIAGFGSEIRRAAWRHGCANSCAEYEQRGQESFSAAPSVVEGQAATARHEGKKGGHCNGEKSRWRWGQTEEKAPEAPITTAQNQ